MWGEGTRALSCLPTSQRRPQLYASQLQTPQDPGSLSKLYPSWPRPTAQVPSQDQHEGRDTGNEHSRPGDSRGL